MRVNYELNIKKIDESLASCNIPESERRDIILKIKEAINRRMLTDSEELKILEIAKTIEKAKNERHILTAVSKLIELLLIAFKLFL